MLRRLIISLLFAWLIKKLASNNRNRPIRTSRA